MSSLGQALLDANVVTQDQLQDAQSGGGSLARNLVERQGVSEPQMVSALARAFGVEEARLEGVQPDPDVLKLVPEETARKLELVPLKKEGATLVVATSDPGDERSLDRLSRSSGMSVKAQVAGPRAVQDALGRFYGGKDGGGRRRKTQKKSDPLGSVPSAKELDQSVRHAIQEVDTSEGGGNDGVTDILKLEINPLDPPVMRVVNGILLKALKMGASDIHVEPLDDEVRVRVRVDGVLVDIQRVTSELKSALVSRIKIMCDMDIAEKRIPQDGGIKVTLDEKSVIDFRVSSLPTIYGEKIVMRVLGQSALLDSIDELGFEGRNLELVREAILNPYGMILVTGPTGSGKTTTLYTILSELNEDDVNIVTAEDPVEYRLHGITQVNVRHNVGLTFDATLRSFLRQDPDIILVGEMRDYETSAIAVKAALTGHLVLSTLHTNDAPSTVVRMVDMGIEPYLVASAVKLVMAQRLMRRICTNCKVDVDLSELERTELDQTTLASIEYMARGEGCDACNNLGYKGRVPIFEIMAVKSRDMRRAITEGGTEVQVAQIARREGMQTLAEGAIELVNQGVTTLKEAMSVILTD